MTIVIDGLAVHEQQGERRVTHRCATRRAAQILAAELELYAAGWATSGIGSSDGARRPLLLPGERMGEPLDGTRSDERAQGFVAAKDASRLTIDACAGLPPIVLGEQGDATEARQIAEWHLGQLGQPCRR